ncbi:MAG: pseudouridine synthase [Bacteroidota bacterium]
MKKQFNKKKFDSRPKRKGDRRTEQGEKRQWQKGTQRNDNREQRSSGGYGERRKTHDFSRGERDRNLKDNRDQTGGNKYGERKKFIRKESLGGERREESKPWEKRKNKNNWGKDFKEKREEIERKPFEKRNDDNRGRKEYGGKREGRETKPWEKREQRARPFGNGKGFGYRRDYKKKRDDNLKKAFDRSEKNSSTLRTPNSTPPASTGLIRLNKYLSNAGICSRREADTFIEAGAVKVNGKIITQLGFKVSPGDKVQFGENTVHKEKSVYILLNKPKGYITTTDDERDRATVLDLIHGIEERIYPVGRLDRNTSGLLLLTNDGDLATKLMRPKYMIPKVYHVELDKPLKPDDMDKIKNGIELEDGSIKPDDIAYVEGAETKKEIGIEIHSGRNRIVRRIFESLGYIVIKLDRVLYAGLTKKNLPRGKWRILADNEVRMLKRVK